MEPRKPIPQRPLRRIEQCFKIEILRRAILLVRGEIARNVVLKSDGGCADHIKNPIPCHPLTTPVRIVAAMERYTQGGSIIGFTSF